MKRLFWLGSMVFAVALFLVARNAASWRPQNIAAMQGRATFQFSPDGRWLLIQNPDLTGVLWDWRDRRLARKVNPGFYRFSPDGRFLANSAMEIKRIRGIYANITKVEITETQSGRVVGAFDDPKTRSSEGVHDAAWSSDGKKLVVVTSYGWRTFEVASGQVVSRWQTKVGQRAASGSTLSRDGLQVVRLLLNNSEIRRTDDGQFVSGLPFGVHGATGVGFSPDSRLVYSAPVNGRVVQFWGVKGTPRKLELVATIAAPPYTPHFTRTPGVLAFAAPSGIELRRVPGGQVVEKISGPRDEPFELAPDGNSAVSCDARGQIYRWRLR